MISLPPPTRVAIGEITIAGVRHEVFLSREWSRYFDSLNTLSASTAVVAATASMAAQSVASQPASDGAGNDGDSVYIPVAGKDGKDGKDGAVIYLPYESETTEYYRVN